MRIAVLADIHGNFKALEAVLADIDQVGVDHIVSLGDNIGYGPEPEEVVRALIERKIDSVLGNHELALETDTYRERLNPAARESLEISLELMSRESRAYSSSLPLNLKKHGCLLVHGSPPTSCTTYLWNPSEERLARLFSSFAEQACFYGHTHNLTRFVADDKNQYLTEEVEIGTSEITADRRFLINPGSVGQPRDGINNQAKYLIWDQDTATFDNRAVPYDIEATVELIRSRGFPEFNATRLLW